MVVGRAARARIPVWENGGDIEQLGGEFVLGPGLAFASQRNNVSQLFSSRLNASFAHRMTSTRSHASIVTVMRAAGIVMTNPKQTFPSSFPLLPPPSSSFVRDQLWLTSRMAGVPVPDDNEQTSQASSVCGSKHSFEKFPSNNANPDGDEDHVDVRGRFSLEVDTTHSTTLSGLHGKISPSRSQSLGPSSIMTATASSGAEISSMPPTPISAVEMHFPRKQLSMGDMRSGHRRMSKIVMAHDSDREDYSVLGRARQRSIHREYFLNAPPVFVDATDTNGFTSDQDRDVEDDILFYHHAMAEFSPSSQSFPTLPTSPFFPR